jgi:tight adherence protein B
MMFTALVVIAVGIAVSAGIFGLMSLLEKPENRDLERRLDAIVASRGGAGTLQTLNLVQESESESDQRLLEWLGKFGDVEMFLDQANIRMPVRKLLLIIGGLAIFGLVASGLSPLPVYLSPIAAFSLGGIPLLWLHLRRQRRLAKFTKQLPEALDLVSRSLRAGHSLGAGIGMVSSEMDEPLKREFGRVFEEQNLGISLEEALQGMAKRVPTMDVRFFATAVTLQRSTGGDLVEIMEKISNLIRSRFRLAGQIQALTGEGRISGLVLLALPPGLFVLMLVMNRDYAMMLFTDPDGRRLLAGTIVMQLLGAAVIRKIIDIKV